MALRRVTLIVLDSVGIGAMPDAADYGDAGAHTLKHCAEAMGGLSLPGLERLGLGRVDDIPGLKAVAGRGACFGKMAEASPAKDTTTGHWEMAGVVSERPPKLYPGGFPKELIAAFEAAIGRPTLGNVAASGTTILEQLGAAHRDSGAPIVYTSADSVFQIACHEERVPIDELYRCCEIARGLCDAYGVGRVIARPFAGEPGNFVRTPRRRDYAMLPPAPTVLEALAAQGVPVVGIGKIGDIFSERGLAQSFHTQSNPEGIAQTFRSLEETREGLIFVNLVDFDMLYGHRRDPTGYARSLAAFDAALVELLEKMSPEDLLLISADHGCDPTYRGTDHTREYVPLLAYAPALRGAGSSLGVRESFADIGATVGEVFGVPWTLGRSFLSELAL
ncbi:MAG: phosphopentomutase [Deltaproteobacteria bacterium]|nr:phosphopentomutase [Deltaproteobacteria bacterium]